MQVCSHNMRQRTSGFTLIELIVTVMIVGILASIAVPSFSGMIATSRVKGAASDLQMSLLKARSEAVKKNAAVTVTPNGGGWNAGWRVHWDPVDEPDFLDSDDVDIATGGPATGVTITKAPAGSIAYLRSGRVRSNAIPSFTVLPVNTAVLTKKSYKCRQILIGPGGAPSVTPLCTGDCSRIGCP